jgi:hypothetical protein
MNATVRSVALRVAVLSVGLLGCVASTALADASRIDINAQYTQDALGHIPVAVTCDAPPCTIRVTGVERGFSDLGTSYMTEIAEETLGSFGSGPSAPPVETDLQFAAWEIPFLRKAMDPGFCRMDVIVGATIHSHVTGKDTTVAATKHLLRAPGPPRSTC